MYPQDKINQYVNKIIEFYQPEKIILFGSYAYGSPDDDSDVDLLIVKDTEKLPIERYLEVGNLLRGSKIDFDYLIRTSSELNIESPFASDFIKEVLMKGKVLYDNGK